MCGREVNLSQHHQKIRGQKVNKFLVTGDFLLLIGEFYQFTKVYFYKHVNMTNSIKGQTIFVLTNSYQKDKK